MFCRFILYRKKIVPTQFLRLTPLSDILVELFHSAFQFKAIYKAITFNIAATAQITESPKFNTFPNFFSDI